MNDSDYTYTYALDYPNKLFKAIRPILKNHYDYDNYICKTGDESVIAFYYNTTMEPYMTDIIKLVETYNAIHSR